jgi:hypothetical protein
MVGPSHAWRSAASSASAFSTSRVLRSRLTPPENFGDLPDAGTVLVRDGLRLAQLVLGRRDQHQGFQALLHPQLLLGIAAAPAGVVLVPHPVLGRVGELVLQREQVGDRAVFQDGLVGDHDIGCGVAVRLVLGRGQVERGREQPGVFPQGFLGVKCLPERTAH